MLRLMRPFLLLDSLVKSPYIFPDASGAGNTCPSGIVTGKILAKIFGCCMSSAAPVGKGPKSFSIPPNSSPQIPQIIRGKNVDISRVDYFTLLYLCYVIRLWL